METQKKPLTFICTCNGCRKVAKRYDSYHLESIAQETEGFYFSESTRRFFGVRLTGFYTLSSGGVLITSTKKAGFDAAEGREIDHAYFCKFGNLVINFDYKTKTQARKGLFLGSDAVDSCTCHGCQIERAEAANG